jgi:hypothetical protein
MRFDLSAVKAAFDANFGAGNWQLQSVSLKLTAALPNNPIFNNNTAGQFEVRWMQDDSWVEGTGTPSMPTTNGITFNTLPGFLAAGENTLGTFVFPGGDSGSTTNPLALVAAFASDITAGASVSMHVLAADNSVSYLFNSRNFGTVSARPELSVTADVVPEPSAIACAALALFVTRRRGR